MKKLLNLLTLTTLASSSCLTVAACRESVGATNDNGGEKPTESKKDKSYYQKIILELMDDIIDCKKLLEEINLSKEYEDENEKEIDKDQIIAEIFDIKAQISDAYFQIWLLESKSKTDQEQILTGIALLRARVTNLKSSLDIKKNYPDEYGERELNQIQGIINVINEIIKHFEKEYQRNS